MVLKKLFSKKDAKKPSQLSDSKGTLEIPEGTHILYGEPGIVFKVAPKQGQTAYLFSKPPAVKSSEVKKTAAEEMVVEGPKAGETEIPANKKKWLVTIKDKTGKDNNIIAEDKFTDEQSVIARPFEYPDPKNPNRWIKHPDVLQVATYKHVGKVNSQLPESGKEIQVKKIGYMYKKDLLADSESFQEFEGDIFPRIPSRADIQQAKMGDCFLLSSLNAILAKDDNTDSIEGTEFIMNMMKQQDDGTTIVRLYHPVTLKPHYVRVENSCHVIGDKSQVHHVAPWVHILEKACAGFGFSHVVQDNRYHAISVDENGQKIGLANQSLLAVYGGGGKADIILTVLTGIKAKSVDIHYNLEQDNPLQPNAIVPLTAKPLFYIQDALANFDEKLLDVNTPLEERLANLEKNWDKIKPLLKQTLIDNHLINEKILSDQNKPFYELYKALGSEELCLDFAIYVNLLAIYHREAFSEFERITENYAELKPGAVYVPQSKEEISKIISNLENLTPPPPAAVTNKLRNYINGERHVDGKTLYDFPGELGEGHYTEEAVNLFNIFKQAHTEGKVITAGTRKSFSEGKVAGLRSEHAYAVTRVHTKIIDGKELMFVRVRNPWGKVGRVYDFTKMGTNEPIAIEDRNIAEFDLDMNDFTRYFGSYEIGAVPTSQKLAEQFTEQAEATLLTRDFKHVQTDDRLHFVNQLTLLNDADRKNKLNHQGVRSLHDLAKYLQTNIANLHAENKIKTVPDIKKTDSAVEKNHRALLKEVIKTFNSRLRKSPEFITIKNNAKKYLNNADGKKVGLLSGLFQKTKTNLKLAILKRHDPEHYLKIYQYHLNYENSQKHKEVLLKNFSDLDIHKKNDFIYELAKLPPVKRHSVMKLQTLHSLNELKDMLHSIKEMTSLASEVEKVKEDLPNLLTSMYSLETLAENYLNTNKDIIALRLGLDEMDKIEECTVTCILGSDDFHVQVKHQGNVIDHLASYEAILQYASAQHAKDNKEVLSKILFEQPGETAKTTYKLKF